MDRQQLDEVLMWIGRNPQSTVEDVIEATGIERDELYLLQRQHGFVLKHRSTEKNTRSRRIGHWERKN